MAEQSGLRGYRFPPGRQEGQREEEGGSLSPLSVMFKRWLGGIVQKLNRSLKAKGQGHVVHPPSLDVFKTSKTFLDQFSAH